MNVLSGAIYRGAKTTFEDLAAMSEERLVKTYHHGHFGALRDAALGELQRRGLRPVDRFHVDCRSGRREMWSF